VYKVLVFPQVEFGNRILPHGGGRRVCYGVPVATQAPPGRTHKAVAMQQRSRTNPRTGHTSVTGHQATPVAARNQYQATTPTGRRTLPRGHAPWLVQATGKARASARWAGSHWATGKNAPVRLRKRTPSASPYTAQQQAARAKYGY
jgi:hypothetical protein